MNSAKDDAESARGATTLAKQNGQSYWSHYMTDSKRMQSSDHANVNVEDMPFFSFPLGYINHVMHLYMEDYVT